MNMPRLELLSSFDPQHPGDIPPEVATALADHCNAILRLLVVARNAAIGNNEPRARRAFEQMEQHSRRGLALLHRHQPQPLQE